MIAEIIDGNTIKVYDLSQFDTDAIMHSGQVFRYFAADGGYRVISGANLATVTERGDCAIIECNDAHYFYDYFDLQTDYNIIKNELGGCAKLGAPIAFGGGIRILRSDFAETVISFIISANNNIKRFTKTLNLLSEKFGSPLQDGLYAFPTVEQLAAVTQDDYKAMGCGYRAPYLVNAVKLLSEIDAANLALLGNDELRARLLALPGVGPKVCSCIMLFCGLFHRTDVAPIDTWINKALARLTECEKQTLLSSRYAGIAQQYIFYYMQHLHKDL